MRRALWTLGLSLSLCPALLLVAEGRSSAQAKLGYPPTSRLLIVNADDLGMSHSVNRAIFERLLDQSISSASVLVPCPWFPEVARFARAHPEVDLGIHLALTSEWTTERWGPVIGRSAVPSLLDAEGYLPLVQDPIVEHAKLDEVERELRAQIEMARRAGIVPTHFDPHMLTLMGSKPLQDLYKRLGREYGVPIRASKADTAPDGSPFGESAILDGIVSFGRSVPRAEWLSTYEKLLKPLPPGVYELVVHVARDDEEMRGATLDHPDWGAAWREADYETVASPEFRGFLKEEGFIVVGWKELSRLLPSPAKAP